MKLDDIKPMHLISLIDELKKKGSMKNATINFVIRVLKNVFKHAEEWELIKKNPASKIKRLKETPEVKEPYNLEEVQHIWEKLEGESIKYQLLFQLALITGLRRSELLGLEWKDIDLENETLTVRQALTYANKQYNIREPKTRLSKRTISLPSSLTQKLTSYQAKCLENKLACNNLWEGGEYFFVFTSWNGKPIHPVHVTKQWANFLKKHNIRHTNLHVLRHTSATLLLEGGEQVKTVQTRLGHSNINTTMNVYAHTLREADERASNKLENMFTQSEKLKAI